MTSVKAIFGGDSRGFEAATDKMARVSKANAAKIAANYQSELAKVETALTRVTEGSTAATALNTQRQFLKRKLETASRNESRGEIGNFSHGGIASAASGAGGRRMNFAVAGSMFTSVARDSAASLASGAPITQVIAQQAPQVLQALAMMKAGTLAWIAVLAGAGVFAWHKITKGIAESVAGVQKLTLEGERLRKQGEATKGARRAADTWEQEALDAKTQQLEAEAAMRERENTADKLKRDRENIDRARMGDLSPQAQARFELANEQSAIYRQIAQEKEFGGNRGAGERNKMESEIIGLQQVATGETEEERRVKDLKIASLRASINASINQSVLDSQNAVVELENRAAKIQAQIDESKKDEAKVETKQATRKMAERTTRSGGFFALSEWERAGGLMAGPNIQQDVSKAHYNEAKAQTRLLTEIKSRLRGGATF